MKLLFSTMLLLITFSCSTTKNDPSFYSIADRYAESLKQYKKNLLNISTCGYKRFSSFAILKNSLRPRYSFSQGSLTCTYKPLDIGITGPGFFMINNNGNFYFTRNGQFKIDKEGFLCHINNMRLYPHVKIPIAEIPYGFFVTVNGSIVCRRMQGSRSDLSSTNDWAPPKEIGKIHLYYFINNEGLEKIDPIIFKKTSESGDPRELVPVSIRQGYLENSNVRMKDENHNISVILSNISYLKKMIHKEKNTADNGG